MQRERKPNAIKDILIAEAMPLLCKDTQFYRRKLCFKRLFCNFAYK